MTIAVDFDGTIVEHRYPAIGKELPFAVASIKQLINEGHRFILWSVREGELLDEAVKWCPSLISCLIEATAKGNSLPIAG